MPEYTKEVVENWKPQPDEKRRYGEEAATRFAVIHGVRGKLMEAFDFLASDASNMMQTSDATYAFNFLWSLINDEHAMVLKQVEESNADPS